VIRSIVRLDSLLGAGDILTFLPSLVRRNKKFPRLLYSGEMRELFVARAPVGLVRLVHIHVRVLPRKTRNRIFQTIQNLVHNSQIVSTVIEGVAIVVIRKFLFSYDYD